LPFFPNFSRLRAIRKLTTGRSVH